ncbi:MAG: response regulator [Rhodospirillaceae bacterium]
MRNGTILVIDDDYAVRHALTLLLREEGLDVETYVSGADCLENCDFREVICAIVDYHMPGMTGVELAERFRAGWLDIPVILLSSMMPAGAEDAARAAGIQAIMRKPPDVGRLCTLIHAARDGLDLGQL